MSQSTNSSCFFCGAGELTPCNCFSGVKSLGLTKEECESCAG